MRRADGRAARAGQPFAAIYVEPFLKTTQGAIGSSKILERRSTRLDGFDQHRPDRVRQGRNFGRSQRIGKAHRADMGTEQSFTHIDIAEARNSALIEQGRLDGVFLVRQSLRQMTGGEVIA